MTEDIKNKIKLDDLKKRYRTVEEENDFLQEKLLRAQKSIKRLRLERTLLLERIDKGYDNSNGGTNSDSDTGSDLLLHNDLMDKNHFSNQHYKHNKQQFQANNTTVIKPPKKKKDPNAPKGPGNVFFLFCRLQRDKIKDENPEENIGDVTKLLGLKWKSLPKEEKQVYYDTFKKEMEEYEEAMKSYKSSVPTLLSDPRTQSLDLTDSAIAESSSSSPNITSPDHQEEVVHLPTLSNMLDNHQSILPKDPIDTLWKEPIIHS
ncbi:high mobility group box domain-containing protein [Thamnidium elegans]|nr:high mobility group box domain-containing protein [Thamnidium elegans]